MGCKAKKDLDLLMYSLWLGPCGGRVWSYQLAAPAPRLCESRGGQGQLGACARVTLGEAVATQARAAGSGLGEQRAPCRQGTRQEHWEPPAGTHTPSLPSAPTASPSGNWLL